MSDMDYFIDPETLLAHTGWLRGFVRSLVLDDSRADDVFQQTLLTAIERPPRQRKSLGGWLATVARNAARQIGRSEGARSTRERAVARGETLDDVSSVVQKAELQRNLVGGVLELEEPYRTVLLLRYFEDLSPGDIASRMKRPAATIRSQLKRGLERLRGQFDAGHGGDRRAWKVALLPLLDLKKPVHQ